MIGLIHRLWNRRRVSNREIRKLMRKLPALGVSADADMMALAIMVKGHSFTIRGHRLYSRYLHGNMPREKLAKYRRMLDYREIIVTNRLGTRVAVDRKIVVRAIKRFRKMVG